MNFRVSVDAKEPYLQVSAQGAAPLAEACALASFVGELCARGGHAHVLADLSAVEPQLSFTDHLQFATAIVELLKRTKAIAVVVPPGYVDAPSARAAKLAGLNIETFLEAGRARVWIRNST